jgi:putative transposase
MREAGIQGAKRRGKPWRTTTSDPSAARHPDLVNRDFTASRPDELWLADFTYLRRHEGAVFFSFVIDAYSRKIVAARSRRRSLVGAADWAPTATGAALDGWPRQAVRHAAGSRGGGCGYG